MWFGFWTFAFLAMLAFTVVLTLLVENWGRWRQPVPVPGASAERSSAAAQRQPDQELVDDLELAAAEESHESDHEHAPTSLLEVRLDGRAAADQLVAVLFASYSAARLPEANRVAAWVTAGEHPPSGDGSICDPGTSLRGRPAAVQRLLECDEQGRSWVTLNEHVDIGLGVHRRPPSCDVLAPLVELWAAAQEVRAELSGDSVVALAGAIETLRPTWSPTTASSLVDPVAEILAEAVAATPTRSVSLTVAAADRADRRDEADDATAPRDATPRVVGVYA